MPLDRPPFTKETQLEKGLDGIDTGAEKNGQRLSHRCLDSTSLPGHPRLKLRDAERLTSFLIQETCAPDLETMTPYLWWMSTQSSGNISPLHHQHVKGREIIITEDPRLHLVWIYNRIFIKPIPRYLLSHAFWEHYLDNPDSPLGIHRDIVRRSALGYLRTWSWLITHESDFIMAKDVKLRLLPLDVTWEEFSAFVDQLGNIADEEVSGRYGGYGELRPTRLNFYGKLIMRKWQCPILVGGIEGLSAPAQQDLSYSTVLLSDADIERNSYWAIESNIADTDLGLRIIYTPEHVDEKHLINIIAIHGIGAHPKKTWTKKVFTDGVLTREHNWLIDPHMLPKEVPNMRVWTFGYDSAWFGIDSVNTSLTGISKRLLSALEREKLTEQPLIFVAHCFGGLVVLKTLLLAGDRPDNNSPTLDLFKYTYGIVFFATPFQGTDPQFAERLVEGAQKMESVVLDDRWLLDILRKGNDTLGELKEGFLRKITRHKRPQVACISEEKMSDIGAIIKSRCIYSLVVDKDSACLASRSDKPTITSHSRARDHFNVSKFTSDTDEDYRIVAEKLKEFAKDAMPTVDRQIIGKQITALQEQSDLPPDAPSFDPAGWKETPFQPFPTKYEMKETKVVLPMFQTSFHIAGLSPDCTLMLLLKPKLAQVFRPQDDLKKPVLELKSSRSEFLYEKGTLGDHVLAITTQYGCLLWNLDSPSPEAKQTISYPSEVLWHLDCVAIHEAEGLVMVAIGVWRSQCNFRCGRVDLYVLDKDNLDTVQQIRMSAEFLDSPKLLNFASNGSLLMCTTSERNRILIWNLDGPSGMEPMSQTARDYTGGSDGITSALTWLSPGGNPYMLCTTSPRAQRARHKGEWTFLAPAGDPFPEDASHCFHCFHHVQRTKHYALHACAIPPQGNIVALLDKTGKLCLVPLRADNRGGITSGVLKDPIEIKEWNLGENDYHMVAIRFDPEGKRLVGVNSHGALRVLDFVEQSVPAATPLLMGPGMTTFSRMQTFVAPGGHSKTDSWSTTDGNN